MDSLRASLSRTDLTELLAAITDINLFTARLHQELDQ
jgi:hypothetical protein